MPSTCSKAEVHREVPRVSDVDMFSNEIVELRLLSGETADNEVQSSGEIEIVPPSQLLHPQSTHSQNASVSSVSSTDVDYAACRQKRKWQYCANVEVLNDVEPDVWSLSCDVSTVRSCHEQKSKHDAVVAVAKSGSVVYSGDKHKLPTSSDAHLPLNRAILATRQSPSDNVASLNAQSNTVVEECSQICDQATQSSVAIHSFHTCPAAVNSEASSEVSF